MNLVQIWNRTFGLAHTRRVCLCRVLRARLTPPVTGKGNKAWRRAEALDRRADLLTWPDYLGGYRPSERNNA